ncbi:hypothetical protein BP5796_07691 [Coleophoma crateriformis]|uniref:Major facilitator superfamily (MFS) profile domain-containing protein n=1 Tax=Coleophoma crateriformis TaxID=565419 RepID=A0A3D8RC70_9HELO|nr:hypothetical protein BP5796_07691 [Coleophoma crateriformis]
MCQIFIAIGGSIFIICEQAAILAASDHQHIAAVLALLYVMGNSGGAIGYAICGAIWTNTFPKALARYSMGCETRTGIQQAYEYAQEKMLIAGTAIIALAFVWILLIRNINLANGPQVKGTVF